MILSRARAQLCLSSTLSLSISLSMTTDRIRSLIPRSSRESESTSALLCVSLQIHDCEVRLREKRGGCEETSLKNRHRIRLKNSIHRVIFILSIVVVVGRPTAYNNNYYLHATTVRLYELIFNGPFKYPVLCLDHEIIIYSAIRFYCVRLPR